MKIVSHDLNKVRYSQTGQVRHLYKLNVDGEVIEVYVTSDDSWTDEKLKREFFTNAMIAMEPMLEKEYVRFKGEG